MSTRTEEKKTETIFDYEVKIDKSVFKVKRIFGGKQDIKAILTDWAVKKALESA